MPPNRSRPGRQSALIASSQLVPSSSWNSEASKPCACSAHRVGPGPVDVGRGDQVVLRVPVAAGEAGHVAVDQVEQAVDIGQVGCPDAVGVAAAAQVEQAPLGDDAAERAPVHQVAGVVHAHARVPLEGRGGQVVVVADPQDRRVGWKPRRTGLRIDRAAVATSAMSVDISVSLRARPFRYCSGNMASD